jgi:putative spermidine/putrescine transport system permease protein
MAAPARSYRRDARPWTFYALATLTGAFLLFLYGPMLVIYVLSFQGPNGGVTFPMVGWSFHWFANILRPGQMANIPPALGRSVMLALAVSALTVVISVSAGLGFRRRFPGAAFLFYLAIASLVMPSLLVGFGIGLGFTMLGLPEGLWTSALGAQLTWTLPFGRRRRTLQPFVRGGCGRSRGECVAAAALRDAADPDARHHRRGGGCVHAVL